MGSIKSLSLYLQSETHLPKIPNHHKSPFSSSCHKQKPQTLAFQPIKKPVFILNLSKSEIPNLPTSFFPNTNCYLSTRDKILSVLKEKLVAFVLGSFIFLGSFSLNARPSLAIPPNLKSASENLRQNRDTQMGQSEGEEEEEMYEKVLEKEPRNVEALKVVLHKKMRKGKMEEAVKYVERLIEIEPKEVEWRLLEALCYELMGNLSKAKRLFKQILKERPLLLRALHGLALAMHKNHEGPAVFEMLSKALEVARHEKRVTEERNIRILIAQMHVVQGQLEEGLKQFQELVNDNPRDFRPYLCQGIIYSLLDKKKEAAEQFELYRSLVPEEFPQRGYMDDVVLAAKTKSGERLQKEFDAQFSYRK